MYKVFFNQHLIKINVLEDFSPFETDELSVADPAKEEVDILIVTLSKETKRQVINLLYSDIENAMEKFKKSFKLIEAAGGKVQNNDGEILFIYRLGMWDLPKGKIEKEENTEEAALREVEEECGISKLHLLSKIKDTWHIYYHKEVFCLKKTYWFAMSYEGNEQLVPQEEEGIEEVIWIGKENLSNYLEKSYPSINELF